MLRNREIQIYLFIQSSISLVAFIIAAIFFSFKISIFVFVTAISLVGCHFIFTKWRYQEISKLSHYLRKISHGDYTLDVREQDEGELSILKNEIYKVTLMLSEHSSFLQQDKVKLTNAISDISHQLKTPLTSMMIMADLLNDGKLPEEKRREFTQNIRIQLERMQWLVSSLLKLSKIDAGTAIFKKEQVFVHRLIEKAAESTLIPMDIKQQSLKINGAEDVTFVGDLNWTTEAIVNILKNAVEHTPEGGVISISYAKNPLFTEIIIEDTGIGIANKDIPYIFKRFYRGENAGEDSVGIGLAMAYSIITSQNGDIEVTSDREYGTRFHIKFYALVV
ncbi:sensor histidine kinase [Neobacillus sp. D3-1R]|uniref:sensor histidine kinase n=1 Tax=Neobacillus sp. D3-1R TaxID=3445778 RepID=UPI003F9F0D64